MPIPLSQFEIVPGSHKRWRSEEEYEAMSHYKGGGAVPRFVLTKYSDLPEMLPVALKAGQTIFWVGDLIHQGRMHPCVAKLPLFDPKALRYFFLIKRHGVRL